MKRLQRPCLPPVAGSTRDRCTYREQNHFIVWLGRPDQLRPAVDALTTGGPASLVIASFPRSYFFPALHRMATAADMTWLEGLANRTGSSNLRMSQRVQF
jgi:hypothetical protein